MKIFKWLQSLFTGQRKSPAAPIGMQAGQSEMMEKFLTMLSKTQEKELTCDEVFALLDQFAELTARGENVSELMPLIQHHLDMCEDCREEYRVLESILHGVVI